MRLFAAAYQAQLSYISFPFPPSLSLPSFLILSRTRLLAFVPVRSRARNAQIPALRHLAKRRAAARRNAGLIPPAGAAHVLSLPFSILAASTTTTLHTSTTVERCNRPPLIPNP